MVWYALVKHKDNLTEAQITASTARMVMDSDWRGRKR